ncbi:MAG: hypothetical protein MRZ24_09440 [Clostridiales bacterium]|nr:hypothetical protein [Clostridiales bacterium]
MSTAIVSFSGRAAGSCAGIARYVQRLTGGELFLFSQFSVHPCGRCGYECFSPDASCPYLSDGLYALYDAIANSAMAYFILPNYCDYPCANFFIFNERSQCYFQRQPKLVAQYARVKKRAIVVSNTEQASFRAALSQQSDSTVDMLFLRAKDFGRISLRGDLMEEQSVRERVASFVTGNT